MTTPATAGRPAADASPRITVLSRPGCHLCEEAVAELAPLARDAGTGIAEVDIDRDDELLRRHLERIPVVLVDDVEICTLFVAADAVRQALAAERVDR